MQQQFEHEALDTPLLPHVTRDCTTVQADQSVGEALASLRSQRMGEKIVYFYVLDKTGRLVGVVPTRRLLMSALDTRIRSIMAEHVVSVPATASVLDACELFLQHRFLAFPVVDDDNRLLGTVDVGLFTDEMVDTAERRASDDVFQLIGVHVARGQRVSPWRRFRERFPWLTCNIVGGILCALIAGFYEGLLDRAIVLALFIPVVLALAESVSVQSMTIALQSLPHRRANLRMIAQMIGKEFVTAFLLGAASGGVVGLVAWVWKGGVLVSYAIGAAICLSVTTACVVGVALPMLIRLLRRDPRIAAGPLVLAIADMATLLFYFNIARQLLHAW